MITPSAIRGSECRVARRRKVRNSEFGTRNQERLGGFYSVFRTPRSAFGIILSILLFGLAASAQESGTISGIVVNTWDGAPLPSVIVTVRGTTLATQTDATGRYELKNVPPGDQVLRFSRSGFAV